VAKVQELAAPVAAELELVEHHLLESAHGHHPLLGQALRHVFNNRGKRLRPTLVLLAGTLGTYYVDRLVLLAASLEVVHTASLVHDDTLDEALARRGFSTINTVWDRHTAIVTGDYLFARSAELAARIGSVRIMQMLSETVMTMCSGEMSQYAASNNWNLTLAEYMERIGAKTGSLFEMCCTGAGVVAELTESEIAALGRFGRCVGLAFQIVDDILDFESDDVTLGKPAANDVRQGTITLPVILFVSRLAPDSDVRARLSHEPDPSKVVDMVRSSGVLDEARSRAGALAAEAIVALDCFPDSAGRRALREIVAALPTRRR
jgi:geranylgeranyl pyrophosphate synthase